MAERYILYITSLEPWLGAAHVEELLLAWSACYPQKKMGGGKERLSVWKSEKERIPNLPKSLANPVSPCSLILSILNVSCRRRMDTSGDALEGTQKPILEKGLE